MAEHEPLRRDHGLARKGEPVAGILPIGFGGSYNYGLMRLVAAILEALRRVSAGIDTKASQAKFEDSRTMFLDNVREQSRIGLFCHLEQCEQLCPQPHADFIHDVYVDLLLLALGMGPTKYNDKDMAAACILVLTWLESCWGILNFDGIVLTPCARAKDEKGGGQWRNRSADKLHGIIGGKSHLKYDSWATTGMERIAQRKDWGSIREQLRSGQKPKLRVPINMVRTAGGGYTAWFDKTPEAVKYMGRDGLTAVATPERWAGQEPVTKYDWESINLPEGQVITIGK